MYKFCAIVALAGLAWGTPAGAEDVVFSGTLTTVCTLALSTPGTLALDADGKLSTAAGSSAQLNVMSVGNNLLTFNAPTLSRVATGYSPTGQTLRVGYSGLNASIADQALTSAMTTRSISTMPSSTLTMDGDATNNVTGFPPGTYELRTVVTCS